MGVTGALLRWKSTVRAAAPRARSRYARVETPCPLTIPHLTRHLLPAPCTWKGVDESRPHDSLFRFAFEDPRHAAPLIRTAMARDSRYAAMLPYIAFDEMRRIDASVVDAADRPFETDLLFEAPIRVPGDEEQRVVFVPIPEHKRHMDRGTAWQSMRYQIRAIDWYRSQPGCSNRWPLVITIVFYHGDEPWTAARDLRDLFELPEHLPPPVRAGIRSLMPSGTYLLDDLRAAADEDYDERKMPLVAHVAVQFLKHLARSDLNDLERHLTRLRAFLVGLMELPNGRPFLGALFWYLMVTTTAAPSEVRETIKNVIPKPTGDVMLNALQRDYRRVLEQGLAEVLVRLMTKRFGPPSESHLASIGRASIAQLEDWTLRVLDAATADEVVRDGPPA